MSDAFWKGYVNANDDVRHVYEQVFYGRQITGNIDATPGVTTTTVTPDSAPHDHADFYAGIWGETLPPEPGAGDVHGSPQLEGPVIDGYATPGAPQIEAPTIEPPGY